MENRVNLGSLRKFHFISHGIDASSDTEWAKIFECQLVVCPASYRRLHICLKLDENLITH